MTARRPVLGMMTAVTCALALAGPSVAAPPQQIYKDLADNGRLDRRYSEADIARALSLKRVIGTDQPATTTRSPAPEAVNPATRGRSRAIPFSGLDAALLVIGGGPLILIGLGLRRRVASTAPAAEVVGS